MKHLRQLKVQLALFLGVLVLASTSHALLLEPIVGIGRTTYDVGLADSDETIPYFGARVGTSFLGITWAALDYRQGSGTFEGVVAGTDLDYDRTILGLTVGVSLPLIRAWVGYNFQDKVKYSASFGGETELDETSIKAGVGMSVFPFVELNLEYITYQDDDIDLDTILLNVSVPLNI